MKKELALFTIEDSCCGHQDQMVNPWMKIGGCAALAAADTCILLTIHNGFTGICPIDPDALSWESYNRFAEILRPYLSPRMMGVNRLSYYLDGFRAYLRDRDCRTLSMEALSMGTSTDIACARIKEEIDAGYPVPILHLNAKTPIVKEYQWHWFLLTGYEETENDLLVKAVTYGEAEWLRVSDLWHEDDPENGGLILYRNACPETPSAVLKRAAAIVCDRVNCPEKVLAARNGETPFLHFPDVALAPEEDAASALTQALASRWNLAVTVTGLLAINEYDDSRAHISERCYKAVPLEEIDPNVLERSGLTWLTEKTLGTSEWRSCDQPLINIIRSDMTDVEVIRRRIAEEEAIKN